MYQQHIYVTENKKNYFLPSIMSIIFVSFKHLKLPISSKIPVTIKHFFLYLQDSYISKFDFMKYLFANQAVAWI